MVREMGMSSVGRAVVHVRKRIRIKGCFVCGSIWENRHALWMFGDYHNIGCKPSFDDLNSRRSIRKYIARCRFLP